MKKSWAFVLFLCLVSAGQAQQFKIIAGPAVSHYSAEWPYDGIVWPAGAHLNPFENRRIGFMAGGGVEFVLSRKVSLELDGLYFQRGSVFERTTMIFTSYQDVYRLSGFNVPLLFKLKLLPGPLPYLVGGLEFSWIVAHRRERFFRPEASLEWIELSRDNLTDATRTFDFGPVVGLGFEAQLSKISLFLETRYSIGLVDLPVRRDRLQPEPRTSSLVVLTGIKFN